MRRLSWCAMAAFIIGAGARATPATAQAAGDTLTAAAAVALALEANPMLRAARLRADAAAERAPQVGALPDPQLSFGLMNRLVGDFGNTGEPMTMNQVQLTQMLPWPGKLGNAAERERGLAAAASFEADESAAMLAARVRMVYSDLAAVDRALEIMEETRRLLRSFRDVSQTRYAVGSGLQQDVLQAQVAVARMTGDIAVMAAERSALAARLNALLDRPATASIGALELPWPGDELPSLDSLVVAAAERRPALRAARERVGAAEAGYRAARRQLYPDFMAGVAYSQRPQFADMSTLMVGISVPLWAGRKQLAQRRELQAEQAMADAELRDLGNETYAELVRWRAAAVRASELVQLYATAVIPQARAAVEAALSAYRVGRVDYLTLVENEMTVNRYEIERVRFAAEFHGAVAQLEALTGAGTGGTR